VSDSTPPRIRPVAPVLTGMTKTVRVNRFGRVASVVIASLIFLAAYGPVTLIYMRIKDWFSDEDFPFEKVLGEDVAAGLVVGSITLVTYLLARSVFSLFRYRLVVVPITACETCHYDLANNASGTCPECGTRIEAPPQFQPQANKERHRLVAALAILVILGAGLFVSNPARFAGWFFGAPGGFVIITPQIKPITLADGTAIVGEEGRSATEGIHGTVRLGKNDSANELRVDQSLENCVVFLNDSSLRDARIDDVSMPIMTINAAGFSPKHLCVIWNRDMGFKESSSQYQPLLTLNRALTMNQINLQANELKTTTDVPLRRFIEVYNFGVGGQMGAQTAGADTAYLHVFRHAYHGLTDIDGNFNFPLPPPGQYDLICEHLEHGRLTTTISVTETDTAVAIDFTYDDWQLLNGSAASQ